MPFRVIRKSIWATVVIPLFTVFTLLFTLTVAVYNQEVAVYVSMEGIDTGEPGGGGAASADIAAVALEEYEKSSENVGGFKYKDWYGLNDNWCAMFVCWCADQCGYIEQGIVPKTASVYGFYSYYKDKGLFHYKEENYTPKAGDIIIYNVSEHTGLVVGYDKETDIVTTVEGNTGSSGTSPYHLGSQVNKREYERTNARITGFCSPQYPVDGNGNWGNAGDGPLQGGETIQIPAGLGAVHTYMGWQTITSPTSLQYQLREEAGENYDSEGFARIGDRYVIACTTTYGGVGDYVDFYQEDGSVIKGIIGDIKNQNDPGCNKWGHENGHCIVEFVVDRDTWYGTGHPNPGTSSCHPEWGQNITKVVNRGNYWG